MSDFNKAVKVVLKNEGKFNNNPHDAGHATAYGISLRFLVLSGIDINADNTIDMQDILALTPFEAKKIYKEQWWDKYRFGEIQSQVIATKIFDLSVNAGCKEITKIVQNTLNTIGKHMPLMPNVEIDGIMGSHTINAINYITNIEKEASLLDLIKTNAVIFYNNIVNLNPKLKIFQKGWLFRARS